MAKDLNNKKLDFGRFDFVKLAPLMGGISLIATLAAIVLIFTKGFNYGIDFAGGTEIQLKFDQPVGALAIANELKAIGIESPQVQSFGEDTNEYLIRLESLTGASDKEINDKLKAQIALVTSTLKSKLGLKEDGVRRVDTVGPQIGSELKRNGILAAFYCFLIILIYVSMRFDYKYAPGAVLCLVHDAVITLGIFSLLEREVNVQIMAAILTLIGYSLNDTIVNFDRIRETWPSYREHGMRFVINKSVNDVLTRTMLTSGATLVAVTILWAMAGGVIAEIAFTLLVGILIGTYSSVYVAAPMILLFEKFQKRA